MPHSQGLSNNPYLSRINKILRIDTDFFKIHFNIVLHLRHLPSLGLLVDFESTATLFHSVYYIFTINIFSPFA